MGQGVDEAQAKAASALEEKPKKKKKKKKKKNQKRIKMMIAQKLKRMSEGREL
jgi:hypothetical protein